METEPKVYKVEIEEKLSRVITVVAKSSDEAIKTIRTAYNKEEYILNEDDYSGVEFHIIEE